MAFRPRDARVDRLGDQSVQTNRIGEAGLMDTSNQIAALKREVQSLRSRLAEAEAALHALVGQPAPALALSSVDAPDPSGNEAAVTAFRVFVERLRESAAIVSECGAVQYCNEALAHMLGRTRAETVGCKLGDFIVGASDRDMQRLLDSDRTCLESALRGAAGHAIPVRISRVLPLIIGRQKIRCILIEDLRREQLQLRHEAVVQASKDAIYALSPDLQIQTWNRGAETIFGYAPAEIIGKSERDLCPPSELDALQDLVRQVQERGAAVSADAVRWRKDRSKIRVILSLTPMRDLDGRTIGYAVVAHDITERERTERQLREAMARTSLALAAGGMGTFELDLATERCTLSDQLYAICELDKATFEPTLTNIRELIHLDDRAAMDEALEKALRDGSFETELRARHRNGRYVWVHCRGVVRRNRENVPLAVFGVAGDITARKQAEKNQQLLIGELNHRVRNTLATVQAIASQTLRRARSPADFVPSFSGRIQALSRAHMLLTRTAWQGTELDCLIREQLLLGSADRISWQGPQVSLEPQTALQLALVLHELGTNARKYGSLSVPQGSVTVKWTLDEDDGGGQSLHLTWTEQDGPPVTKPESTGFGTLLIERSLQQGQGGNSRICFDPAGVKCTISLPLSRSEVPLGSADRVPGQ